MWKGQAGLIAPLSKLTSVKAKWEWTDVHRKSFCKIKELLSKEVLLTYPNFNEPFEIHTDASDVQLGAVISQNSVPIAFCSRKLNKAQRNYTVTERELLAIVETLKEYRNILLGQQIKVFTDHKNLTRVDFNTQRVIRWRMVIEDFAPEIVYIPGAKNIVPDAMSRLAKSDTIELNTFNLIEEHDKFAFANYLASTKIDKQTNCNLSEKHSIVELSELFVVDELLYDIYPLNFKLIEKEQVHHDTKLIDFASNHSEYTLEAFHGGGKSRQLLCKNGKIVIPHSLQHPVADWYPTLLCPLGVT
jgi:hypothetical protein